MHPEDFCHEVKPLRGKNPMMDSFSTKPDRPRRMQKQLPLVKQEWIFSNL
jgi:hypothetical protein